MKIEVKVEGLKEIIQEIKNAQKIEKLEEVMELVMEEALNVAKGLCPVDTGFMVTSMHIRHVGTLEWALSVDADYASFNEWGWYGIPPVPKDVTNPQFYKGGYRPFVRPAFWITYKQYPKYIKRILFNVKE